MSRSDKVEREKKERKRKRKKKRRGQNVDDIDGLVPMRHSYRLIVKRGRTYDSQSLIEPSLGFFFLFI